MVRVGSGDATRKSGSVTGVSFVFACFALPVRLWRGIVAVSRGRRCVAWKILACRSACAFPWYVTRVRVV